jgi:hypothetical protein
MKMETKIQSSTIKRAISVSISGQNMKGYESVSIVHEKRANRAMDINKE